MTLLLIILVAVILIVIATGKFKIHPFIALLLASFFCWHFCAPTAHRHRHQH